MSLISDRRKQAAFAQVSVSESKGVRYLHLGTPWIQGAMRIQEPLHLELDYIERMMAWLLWAEDMLNSHVHAMQLGLGAGALTKYCVHVLGVRTTVVELNPQVVKVCERAFALDAAHPLLTIHCTDALGVIVNPIYQACVDVLHVDLYDPQASKPLVHTHAHYRACQQMLTSNGVAVFNLFGRNARFAEQFALLKDVFGSQHLACFKPTSAGNTVVLAGEVIAQTPWSSLGKQAQKVEERWQLPAQQWLRVLSQH